MFPTGLGGCRCCIRAAQLPMGCLAGPLFPVFSMSLQVFGIVFTISQGQIIDNYGTMPGNIFLCVFLTLGAVLTGESGPQDKVML